MSDKTFSPFPILTTQRLSLRKIVMNDEKEMFALRAAANPYLDRPVATTIDDARNFITRIVESDVLYWTITFNGNNILVGTICLFDFSKEDNTCEIGYELLPGYQGQGIMTEAIEKVIDYAFNTIKVQTIIACCHRDNSPSIKLLEKFLFRQATTDADLIYYQLTAF